MNTNADLEKCVISMAEPQQIWLHRVGQPKPSYTAFAESYDPLQLKEGFPVLARLIESTEEDQLGRPVDIKIDWERVPTWREDGFLRKYSEQGWGFIRCEFDGVQWPNLYMARGSLRNAGDIQDALANYPDGVPVSFTIGKSKNGPMAFNVNYLKP